MSLIKIKIKVKEIELMNAIDNNKIQTQIYHRLIALWIICEAFAGGLMHGFKVPFSGLIISSLAIICITLIAYFVPEKSAIIKATIIVAIFKLMLSPHSPGTAYIAVFFQGFLGHFLFKNKKYFGTAAILLGILGAVESSIQRLLVLVIVYGNTFWKALNVYINKLTGEQHISNYSLYLAIAYVIIHAIVGFIIGVYGFKIARNAHEWKIKYPDLKIETLEPYRIDMMHAKKKTNLLKWILFACWLLLVSLYAYSWIYPNEVSIPKEEIIGILIRSTILIISWYLIVGPLFFRVIKRYLERRKIQEGETINAVTTLLPDMSAIFIGSWKISGNQNGLQRYKRFVKILIINTI